MIATTIPKAIRVVDSCCTDGASTNITEAEAECYATWMRALADPTRIRIVNMLAVREEPVCVCEFVDAFPLGQSTISHHLKILRDARFIFAERRGTFMYYQIDRSAIAGVPEGIRHLLDLA